MSIGLKTAKIHFFKCWLGHLKTAEIHWLQDFECHEMTDLSKIESNKMLEMCFLRIFPSPIIFYRFYLFVGLPYSLQQALFEFT